MTKEELEKEAEEGYIKRIRRVGVMGNYRNQTYNDGYLDGAEPREKRITELEQKLETERSSRIALVNKIEELEKKYQELVDKLHHCWNCKKSFDKSCSFGKMLEADKKKCKDWDSTFGISD